MLKSQKKLRDSGNFLFNRNSFELAAAHVLFTHEPRCINDRRVSMRFVRAEYGGDGGGGGDDNFLVVYSEFPFSCFFHMCDPPGGKDVFDNLNVPNYQSFVLIFIAAFSKIHDNN
jgi:hypothetical protein